MPETPDGDSSRDLALPDRSGDGKGLLRADELAKLFTPELIAELKLTLLTGSDSTPRIEAIRKLAYAPLPAEEKGVLFLRCLIDPDSRLRSEAARILKDVGLSGELSDALSGLSEESTAQREMSLRQLHRQIDVLESMERVLCLAVLVGTLRHAASAEFGGQIVRTIARFGAEILQHADFRDVLLRDLVKWLEAEREAMESAFLELVQALLSEDPEGGRAWLTGALSDIDSRELEAVFLEGLLKYDPEVDGTWIERSVSMIGDWDESDLLCRRLGDAIIRQRGRALRPLIAGYSDSREEQRTFLIQVITACATQSESSDAELADAADLISNQLSETESPVRQTALESDLLHHHGLPDELRTKVAVRLLRATAHLGLETHVDLVSDHICELGVTVIDPLMEEIRGARRSRVREAGVRILADAISTLEAGESGVTMDDVFSLIEEVSGEDDVNQDRIRESVGRLLSSPAVSADRVTEGIERMIGTIRSGKQIVSEARALGFAARHPEVSGSQKVQALSLMIDLLEVGAEVADSPGLPADEVFRFDSKADQMIELIPALLDGIETILQIPGCPVSARGTILHRLVNLWRPIAKYEVIWAPGNSTRLAETVAAVASLEDVPSEERLLALDSLLLAVENVPAVLAIGELCAVEEYDPVFGGRCVDVGEQFCKMLSQPDFAETDHQDALYASIANVVQATALGNEENNRAAMQRRWIRVLGEGMAQRRSGARVGLERLLSSGRLEDGLAAVVQEQLEENDG